MTGRAVEPQVADIVRAVVGSDLEHVMNLELLRRRKLVSMAKTDLAAVTEIGELPAALAAVALRRGIRKAHPLKERSAAVAVQAGEMRAFGEREGHPCADIAALFAALGGQLSGDGFAVELHWRSMNRPARGRNWCAEAFATLRQATAVSL